MPASVVRPATILVAITTYRRPLMLQRALAACAALRTPPGVWVHFLVVDNDAARPVAAVVRATWPCPSSLEYVSEPARGLAAVRNRALDEARRRSATALAFCDDDEAPDPDWLCELWWAAARTGADLIGGPVYLQPPAGPTSRWQRWIFRSLTGANAWTRGVRWVRAVAGRRVTITTNNWMLRLALLDRAPLRFDERFALSGGEDTDFFRQVVATGGRTAWVARARMRELVPGERLSCWYVFRRRFDSTVVRTGEVAARRGRFAAALRFAPGSGCDVVAAAILFLIAPLTLCGSLPLACAHLGRVGGFFSGLWGGRSVHYRTPAGF